MIPRPDVLPETIPPLRLGYIVSQYPATNHTFILREIRTLRSLGFEIQVISIRPADRPADALSIEEAEEQSLTESVLGLGIPRILAAQLSVFARRPIRYVSGLLHALRLASWDLRKAASHLVYFAEAVVAGDLLMRRGVRHAHTHFASTVTLFMATVFPIEFSITIHGPDEFNDVAGFLMAEKVARAKLISTISRFAASQTMRASRPEYWSKIHPMPLGVDTEAFAPQSGASKNRGTFNVLCVGRLAAAKALHILIASIGRLVAAGRSHVRLTVVGGGPEQASLQEMIERENLGRYVTLAGPCNHDRVIEFYRETDVFAMASFAEGVPVVLMEAMAMEIPCVATWIAGIPELIRAEIDGLLVPPADPEALAAALMRLMDDPDLRRRIGRSGRERVVNAYNLARNTEALAGLFRASIG